MSTTVQSQAGGALVTPASLLAEWKTVNVTTLGTLTDAVPVDVTAAGVAAETNHRIFVADQGRCTYVAIRLLYPTGTTVTTNLKYQLFGRTRMPGSTTPGDWSLLPDVDGELEIAFAADPTLDPIVAASLRGTPAKIHDAQGCNEFWAPSTVALDLSANESLAQLQAKAY